MEEADEVAGGFFVACGDAAVVFESIDEAFDQIAASVEVFLDAASDTSYFQGGDHGPTAAAANFPDQFVVVVGLVGDDILGTMVRQQRIGLATVVLLAGRQPQLDRTPLRVDRDVNLGAESAARASQRFVLFFSSAAPAAC